MLSEPRWSRSARAGGDDGEGSGAISWWHIQNVDPLLPVWEDLAKQYQREHSGVTFDIQPIENEAFKARLTTPPATWADLLDAVRALRSSGVTPISGADPGT